MRIIDIDGTVYYPMQFMDTAKKFHIYTLLSRDMLKQVFTLFKGRREAVSFNFSAYDINSEEMQSIIFELLEEIGDASNFILEILEDEQFKDLDKLSHFIEKLRLHGIKVAIDDFGSGYSNFLEIMEIKPDFIKGFAAYLSTKAGLHNGTIWEKCMWLKGVVMCVHFNGLIPKKTFAQFHISPNVTEREFLTEDELKTLMTHELGMSNCSIFVTFLFSPASLPSLSWTSRN